jgi:hypothetical protein
MAKDGACAVHHASACHACGLHCSLHARVCTKVQYKHRCTSSCSCFGRVLVNPQCRLGKSAPYSCHNHVDIYRYSGSQTCPRPNCNLSITTQPYYCNSNNTENGCHKGPTHRQALSKQWPSIRVRQHKGWVWVSPFTKSARVKGQGCVCQPASCQNPAAIVK